MSLSENSLRKNEGLYEFSSSSTSAKAMVGLASKPEVLAPAGGWPQMRAAVANGADAVYFGLQEGFNARARASNFPVEELAEVMGYLHERGVKGYLVINVLVFDEEMENLERLVRKIAAAGVDALIMQDMGAISLVRQIAPNLPVHASTQMSITDSGGALFAKRQGVERVVVGRELSVKEITAVSRGSNVEIEAFVHGALCVSYSGQCFSSEAWGGRSANRGQCAQACRMPYGLVVNGTLVELLDDVKYLLSPQDLMAIDYVPDLIAAGVQSFKIEGRLKGPEYVGITTRAYRLAVDEAWESILKADSGVAPAATQQSGGSVRVDADMRKALKQVFSRGQDGDFDGLSAGFMGGPHHQSLVRGRSPRHRGLYIGKVVGTEGSKVIVDTVELLKRGDGVVFDRGSPEEQEEGGSVFDVKTISGGRMAIAFERSSVDMSRVSAGDLVWKNKDVFLDQQLKVYAERADSQTVDVSVAVSGQLGEPLEVTVATTGPKWAVPLVGKGRTQSALVAASKRPLGAADLSKAIGMLGDSSLRPLRSDSGETLVVIEQLGQALFVPVSEIKAARRTSVESLVVLLRSHDKDAGLRVGPALPQMRKDAARTSTSTSTSGDSDSDSDAAVRTLPKEDASSDELTVLCRTPGQVTAVCSLPWMKEVTLDFLEVHGLKEAVAEVRAAGKKVVVATPRIIKPNEERLLNFYLRLGADALLVRSLGFLNQLIELRLDESEATGEVSLPGFNVNVSLPELRGDFSLNAANAISSDTLLRAGLSRLTPTHDLNAKQIATMAKVLGSSVASKLEVIIHQHMPVFHTEHCVFCRFLSDGNSYKDCGHPCEKNSVSLRSFDGQDHLVLADMGCRNTVFEAKAQSGAQYINDFVDAGIRHFRVELIDERPADAVQILELYRSLVVSRSSADAEALYSYLESLPNNQGVPQGVTAGSLKPSKERSRDGLKPTARR